MAGMFGLYNNYYKKARGSRILIYHGICLEDHTRFNPIFLKLKTFESHLKFYKRYFNVLSLDDFYNQRFSNDRFNICISFDDGYANNHKYVLPLLEKYQLPATFFITAICEAGYDILWNDFLGIFSKYGPRTLKYKNDSYTRNRFGRYISVTNGKALADILRSGDFDVKKEMMEILSPLISFRKNRKDVDYWLQMTTNQVCELAASKWATIGSHGYYHNDLSRIPLQDARTEMIRSKRFLENIINKEVQALAFPYGAYTKEVVQEAKQAGFSQLLNMDFLFPDDQADTFMRERFTINPFISVHNQMRAIIKGRYENYE